jgi:hypothetical protein
MGKLYELLAVEGAAQARAVKLVLETKAVLSNKENLFKGHVRTLKLFNQDATKAEEILTLEQKDSTQVKVETTVPDSINYMACVVGDYWDAMYQKEATNQMAKADVIIDGVVIIKDAPATFLLAMEARLKDLRPILEAIPTLAPGVDWQLDANYAMPNVYRGPVITDTKTKEDTEYRHVFEPTDKQPGQFVPVKTQFNIGRYTRTDWSGLISPADKARRIEQFDKFEGAIKQARQRANAVDVVAMKVSDDLMTALFGDWFNRERMNPVKAG